MENDKQKNSFENIQKKLRLFFPAEQYPLERMEDEVESGEILAKSLNMLPYLQTALIDEKILEVELDGMTRVYFSRIYDHLPDMEEVEEDGETILKEPEYTSADYLKRMSHLILLPLEPGLGNLHVRNCKKVMLRMFTSNYALEFGTFFQELTTVRELPVLRLAYPVIGRQVKGAREFRAKVPTKLQATTVIRDKNNLIVLPTNISAHGMVLQVKKEEQKLFQVDKKIQCIFFIEDLDQFHVSAVVRHISKIRGKKGTEFVVGVQFDLTTRALASEVEQAVAMVQRAHLKELSDLAEESGLTLIK